VLCHLPRGGLALSFSGVSLATPTGTHFQFRCDGHEPLSAIGATMPLWPGESEAVSVGNLGRRDASGRNAKPRPTIGFLARTVFGKNFCLLCLL
jgi:hypothetical protein